MFSVTNKWEKRPGPAVHLVLCFCPHPRHGNEVWAVMAVLGALSINRFVELCFQQGMVLLTGIWTRPVFSMVSRPWVSKPWPGADTPEGLFM